MAQTQYDDLARTELIDRIDELETQLTNAPLEYSRRSVLAAAAGIAAAGAMGVYATGSVAAQPTGTFPAAGDDPLLKIRADRLRLVGRTSDPSNPTDGTVWYRGGSLMGRGIVESGLFRGERYEIEERTTDPASTSEGAAWIRTDIAPDAEQIATLRFDAGGSTWDVPVFDESASTDNVAKAWRVRVGGHDDSTQRPRYESRTGWILWDCNHDNQQ